MHGLSFVCISKPLPPPPPTIWIIHSSTPPSYSPILEICSPPPPHPPCPPMQHGLLFTTCTTFGFRALMLPLRYSCKSKISLQSKFQLNRTSGSRDTAILFKIWPKFDPSSGTLGPIPKIFTMYNLPYCVGSVSKFQPPRTKTVAGVWKVWTFLASILYIYRFWTLLAFTLNFQPQNSNRCSPTLCRGGG